MNKDTPRSDPVSDFFNAPDEVKRPVYERALQKAQEEQSNTDWREEYERQLKLSIEIKSENPYLAAFVGAWDKYDDEENDCAMSGKDRRVMYEMLNHFSSQLLEAEKKRWREEVEGMKKNNENSFDYEVGEPSAYSYSEALDAVLQKLS